MMRAVPFGMAVRRRRLKRDSHETRCNRDAQHLDVHLEHEARIGARSIATQTAWYAEKNGKWEREGDMYRLRP